MTPQNEHRTDTESWSDCPPGEIGTLVSRLQSRRRRQTRRQVAVGVSMMSIVLLVGVYAVPHFGLVEPAYGGVVCSEVQSLADEYIAGRLDGGMSARIDVHLESCSHCRPFISNLRQKRSSTVGEHLPLPKGHADPAGRTVIASLGR